MQIGRKIMITSVSMLGAAVAMKTFSMSTQDDFIVLSQ